MVIGHSSLRNITFQVFFQVDDGDVNHRVYLKKVVMEASRM